MNVILTLTTILVFAFGACCMSNALNPKIEKVSEKALYSGVGLISMMCLAYLWGVI
jgi:hypothetical protein